MNKVIISLIFLALSFNSKSEINSLTVKCPSSNKLVNASFKVESSVLDREVNFFNPRIEYRCFLQFKVSSSGFHPDRSTLSRVCSILTGDNESILLDYSESGTSDDYKVFINNDGNAILSETGNSFMNMIVCSI